MDAFSSVTAPRPLWSKQTLKKPGYRKEPSVALPVLTRRPPHGSPSTLHSYLSSQLDGDARNSFGRSQLRAMASSKLQFSSSNNNNLASVSTRFNSSSERLAPLDPDSFEKTRNRKQSRALPEPLQAAINEVLAVKSTDESSSDREDRRSDHTNNNFEEPETPIVPTVKRGSPNKAQLQSRKPEWRRYIRRIMVTKGIQGSTLARYRRLVGIVARKNLSQSLAGAAERVVRYRLEFRSAAVIQVMINDFLKRRRQAKKLQRHRAAVKLQQVWRGVLEIEKQRKLAEIERAARIERLIRFGATRAIQRSYRKYRYTCYLREEERRQQHQTNALQKARQKLLRRYQSWRDRTKRDKVDQTLHFTSVEDVIPGDEQTEDLATESYSNPNKSELSVVYENENVKVPAPGDDMTMDKFSVAQTLGAPEQAHLSILLNTEMSPPRPSASDVVLDQHLSYCLEECVVVLPELGQPSESLENLTTSAYIDENQFDTQNENAVSTPAQDNQDAALPNSLSCREIDPEVFIYSDLVKSEPEDDTESGDNNEVETPVISAESDNIQQSVAIFADVVEEESASELAAIASAEAEALVMARSRAAERVVRFLLPKLQFRRRRKVRAAIQIQCLVRSCRAKQCLVRVRIEALHLLRAKLLASWRRVDTKEKASEQGTPEAALEPNDDEDDELDLELQGYQSSSHDVADNYLHLLPTRNGQIPPGVPLFQSSAGAPLLSLWKWSWTGEKWVSSG